MTRIQASVPGIARFEVNLYKLVSCYLYIHLLWKLPPISGNDGVVDGQGILNLMHAAESRCTVPCRKTIMGLIDQKYHMLKEWVADQVGQNSVLSLTIDMWTSRAGDGYISLTAHYIKNDFKLFHQNLSTCHFPGTHDHLNIAEILQKLADTWHIDLDDQVSCFATDNGSNIVKSLKDDLDKMHIPCAGHTLNLCVEAG